MNEHRVDGNRLSNVAPIGRVFSFLPNLHRAVIHHRKIRILVPFGFGGNIIALHNERAQRLTRRHVVIRSVHGGNRHSLIAVALIKRRDLLRELRHTVGTVIHSLIRAVDTDGVHTHIRLSHVVLDPVSAGIVNHNLVLRHTWSEGALLVG